MDRTKQVKNQAYNNDNLSPTRVSVNHKNSN